MQLHVLCIVIVLCEVAKQIIIIIIIIMNISTRTTRCVFVHVCGSLKITGSTDYGYDQQSSSTMSVKKGFWKCQSLINL